MQKKEIEKQIIEEIFKTTLKIKLLINSNELDIKKMADLHRYSETRKFMIDSLKILYTIESW